MSAKKFKKLPRKFYTRKTLVVAKDLLGKYLIRKIGPKLLVGKIVETEAYIGPEDKASHAFGGKITKRNKAEYLIGGHIYIYLVYGMYWQLNITTAAAGKPECVLIRALEPTITNLHESNSRIFANKLVKIREVTNGPGKLCLWMKLDKLFNEEDLCESKRIWVAASSFRREDRGLRLKKSQIITAKRIGIDYAGKWKEKPWRFYIKGNSFVSKQ